MRPLAPLLLAASLCACATTSRSRQCRVRAPAAQVVNTAPAAPPPPPEQPTAQPTAPAPVVASAPRHDEPTAVEATASGGSGSVAEEPAEDCDSGGAAPDPVAAQEAVIARNQSALASAVSACREVCAASGNICTAAAEICRLTGDGHDRCARARGACTDASRRRDGQCPACPTP